MSFEIFEIMVSEKERLYPCLSCHTSLRTVIRVEQSLMPQLARTLAQTAQKPVSILKWRTGLSESTAAFKIGIGFDTSYSGMKVRQMKRRQITDTRSPKAQFPAITNAADGLPKKADQTGLRAKTQRVQLECHYGIRSQNHTIYGFMSPNSIMAL